MLSEIQILIADQDSGNIFATESFSDLPFECRFTTVDSPSALHECIEKIAPQLLIIDMNFNGDEAVYSLLKTIQKEHPKLSILPVIPAGKPYLVKDLLDLDLFFFLHKPLEPIEATLALKRAYECVRSTLPALNQVAAKQKHQPFHGMIGTSKPMLQLYEMISKVAEDDLVPILIRGESGTGKKMVAKAIHAQSKRKNKNFVPVNCAVIPEDLLESELFGYTKGAFTYASNKPGHIQYADQGTLFLDEIGDMKFSMQAKLLRIIQEKEFEPVGAFKSIPVNTRILAATHCDLETLVKEGKFREDLYYRLSIIPLNIPSLRDRKQDIPLLIEAFLDKHARKQSRKPFTFSSQAYAAIASYNWQGNVRELKNLIQHMSVLYSGKQVQIGDLPDKIQSQKISWEGGQIDFNEIINDFETQLIVQALKQTDGNKKEAAKLLSLKRTTLLEKIKKKAIDGLWKK